MAPPSYQESHNHLTSTQQTSPIDCPPPTYEESLKHKLARYDEELGIILETSFAHNTVSVHHGSDQDGNRVDPDHFSQTDTTLNQIRAGILNMSRYSEAVNSAFDEDDEPGLVDLNVSRISRRINLQLNQSRDSKMSRARAPTVDSVLNMTRTSMQPHSSAQANCSFARESQLPDEPEGSNSMNRRRHLRHALEKQRLSKSYDDILNSKALNISVTNLDLVSKNTASSSNLYSDPEDGTLRRRAKSETNILSRLSSKDSVGGLTLRRQSASNSRETFI